MLHARLHIGAEHNPAYNEFQQLGSWMGWEDPHLGLEDLCRLGEGAHPSIVMHTLCAGACTDCVPLPPACAAHLHAVTTFRSFPPGG